jgi:aldehyde:ferredoxin oxidoreductase
MYGFSGTLLRVDLDKQKISRERLNKELAYTYGGGKGINIKVLYDEITPGIDPLGPDNKIIFGVGPCNGTLVPSSCRFTVTTKSPMSGFIGDSNSSGSLGVGLKYAGYDMVIIQGKAKRPQYLFIDDDAVELRDASHLWGKTTQETRRAIEEETGDPEVCVACIGPAGETLVRFASITTDLGRSSGRTGVGAVLGSKKLKALVVRGTKGVQVAHPDLLEEAAQQVYRAWREDMAHYEVISRCGISALMKVYNKFGVLPTKNYLQGTFDRIHLVTGERLAEHYFVRPKSCFSCPVPCDHLYAIDSGPYRGVYGEAFEMSQLEHFSSRLMIDDLDFVIKASALCNEYGIDMMEMAQLIAYAMECFEHHILTPEDTGGLRVEWGNADAALVLMDMILHRKGIGDLFAEGVKKASEEIGRGSERFALTVKGLTISTRDPRGSKAWGLGYAVAARGADHCRHLAGSELPGSAGFDPLRGEVLHEPGTEVDPLSEKGKAQLIKWYEDVRSFQNCMEVCLVSLRRYPKELGLPGILAKLYNAVTGFELSERDILKIGERVVNVDRAFNVREGLSRKDDTLPQRFLEEPLPDGPARGHVVNLDPMLDEYYELRGWDKRTGFPTKGKLAELDLEEIIDDLEGMGKLAGT